MQPSGSVIERGREREGDRQTERRRKKPRRRGYTAVGTVVGELLHTTLVLHDYCTQSLQYRLDCLGQCHGWVEPAPSKSYRREGLEAHKSPTATDDHWVHPWYAHCRRNRRSCVCILCVFSRVKTFAELTSNTAERCMVKAQSARYTLFMHHADGILTARNSAV